MIVSCNLKGVSVQQSMGGTSVDVPRDGSLHCQSVQWLADSFMVGVRNLTGNNVTLHAGVRCACDRPPVHLLAHRLADAFPPRVVGFPRSAAHFLRRWHGCRLRMRLAPVNAGVRF